MSFFSLKLLILVVFRECVIKLNFIASLKAFIALDDVGNRKVGLFFDQNGEVVRIEDHFFLTLVRIIQLTVGIHDDDICQFGGSLGRFDQRLALA